MTDFRLNYRFVDSNGESGRLSLPWRGDLYGDQIMAHHGDAVRSAYRVSVLRETGRMPEASRVRTALLVLENSEAFLTIIHEEAGAETYAMTGHVQVENAASGVGADYVRRYPMKS
jgi:hypothetical protein